MKTFARQIFFLSFWPHSYIPLNSYQVIRDYAESQIYSERSSNPYCCRTYAIIASSLIGIDGYFSTTKIAYSQSDPDQMNSNTTDSVNIQDIPLEKVRVGDIDVAYDV